jgi:NADH-quinone oxidoreductase subunit J
VYAVFALIVAFFNGAGLFLLLGAEFLAFILLIVYVGAVAVLFLFVVMMVGADEWGKKQSFFKSFPLFFVTFGVLGTEIIVFVTGKLTLPTTDIMQDFGSKISNIHAIGNVLYTQYFLPFQLVGLLLFVAMIGAIVLTLRNRTGVKRQNIKNQLKRKPSDTLEYIDVPLGKGIKTK